MGETETPPSGEPKGEPPVDHRRNFDAWYEERRQRERDEEAAAKKKADDEEAERKKKTGGAPAGDHSEIAPRTPPAGDVDQPKRKHAGTFW